MRIRIKKNHWLPKRLKVLGITIYPYIFVRVKKPSARLIAHELVHIDQVRSVGWFRFYISYLLYYRAGQIRGLSDKAAYLKIPYELEARIGETGKTMLKRAQELLR